MHTLTLGAACSGLLFWGRVCDRDHAERLFCLRRLDCARAFRGLSAGAATGANAATGSALAMALPKSRDTFLALCTAAGMSADHARLLVRHARTLQRLAVEDCNRELYPWERKKIDSCTRRIHSIVARYSHLGFAVDTAGDPRGAVVQLLIPGHHGNDFGGTGYECVPTWR